MRQLAVKFGKRFRKGYYTFAVSPSPIKVAIYAVIVIFTASIFSYIVMLLSDASIGFSNGFLSFCTGVLLNLYFTQRYRIRTLEMAVTNQAAKAMVAVLADGRPIWIRDGDQIIEAAPPQFRKEQKGA